MARTNSDSRLKDGLASTLLTRVRIRYLRNLKGRQGNRFPLSPLGSRRSIFYTLKPRNVGEGPR